MQWMCSRHSHLLRNPQVASEHKEGGSLITKTGSVQPPGLNTTGTNATLQIGDVFNRTLREFQAGVGCVSLNQGKLPYLFAWGGAALPKRASARCQGGTCVGSGRLCKQARPDYGGFQIPPRDLCCRNKVDNISLQRWVLSLF